MAIVFGPGIEIGGGIFMGTGTPPVPPTTGSVLFNATPTQYLTVPNNVTSAALNPFGL